MESTTSMSLSQATALPDPTAKATIAFNVINACRPVSAKYVRFKDFLDAVRIQEDSSVSICKWKGPYDERAVAGIV